MLPTLYCVIELSIQSYFKPTLPFTLSDRTQSHTLHPHRNLRFLQNIGYKFKLIGPTFIICKENKTNINALRTYKLFLNYIISFLDAFVYKI